MLRLAEAKQALSCSWESECLELLSSGSLSVGTEQAYELGESARKKKWFKCAEIFYRRACAGSPQLIYLAGLAECQFNLAMWRDTIETLDAVLEKDAKNRRALRTKAKCLARLEEFEAAITVLEQYAKVAKRWAEPWADLARVHAKMRNWNLVIEASERAIERGGRDEEVLELIIISLFEKGRFKEAETYAGSLAELDMNLSLRLVGMHNRAGEYLKAGYTLLGVLNSRGVDWISREAALEVISGLQTIKPSSGSRRDVDYLASKLRALLGLRT